MTLPENGQQVPPVAAALEHDRTPVASTVADNLPQTPGQPEIDQQPDSTQANKILLASQTSDLQLKKLQLEIKDLEEKTSIRGRAKGLLDALIPLAAIAGLVITVLTTKRQFDNQSKDVLRSRYQVAYTDLGANTTSQRLTGAYLLADLLGTDPARDTEVLRALVDALAGETDVNVRLTLKRILTESRATKEAKSAALEEVVNRQVGLETASELSHMQLAMARRQRDGWLIPMTDNLSWRESGKETWTYVSDRQQTIIDQLHDLGLAFVFIYNSGGRTKRMGGLFIDNFRLDMFAKEEVADARFDTAILPNCDFGGARLPRANFNDAILIGTNFSGAHLENASFFNDFEDPVSASIALLELDWGQIRSLPPTYELRYKFPAGPYFQGAHLEGARFGGTLFTLIETGSGTNRSAIPVTFPNFRGAFLDGAEFFGSDYSIVRYLQKPEDGDHAFLGYGSSYPPIKDRVALYLPRWSPVQGINQIARHDYELRAFASILLQSASMKAIRLPPDVADYLVRVPKVESAK